MGISRRKDWPPVALRIAGDSNQPQRFMMKRIVAGIGCLAAGLALLGGCRSKVDLEVAGMIDRAQQTFDGAESKDDFLRAAGEYQAVIDRGIVSGAVFFNQGNAYMRADERGRAIASYRQAKRYRPRDPYLDANLRSALGGDEPQTQRRVVDFLLFWQDWVSYPGKFQVTASVAFVSFLFGVVAILGRQRWCRHLALGLVVIAVLVGMSAGYDWYRFDAITHGVVVVDEAVARKGNATSYEPAFTKPLEEGTEFEALEQRGDWVFIRLPAGQEAWIEKVATELY